MLFGEDMLDVEEGNGRGEIGQMAVLAPRASAFADKLAKRLDHQVSSDLLSNFLALA